VKRSDTKPRSTDLSARAEGREARTWIERQLRWERTLGALRNQQIQRKAA